MSNRIRCRRECPYAACIDICEDYGKNYPRAFVPEILKNTFGDTDRCIKIIIGNMPVTGIIAIRL